ncbi:hypothetical protein RRG08_023983 [Elysia crispata]|uniref:Uncharacterized protein n=1 Tax=Elysia crispata TaxID=231223 RepID=A0AAE0YNH1_9GAST|nr:hypothetical protein RRG08_023983 [Elysia crispata]
MQTKQEEEFRTTTQPPTHAHDHKILQTSDGGYNTVTNTGSIGFHFKDISNICQSCPEYALSIVFHSVYMTNNKAIFLFVEWVGLLSSTLSDQR